MTDEIKQSMVFVLADTYVANIRKLNELRDLIPTQETQEQQEASLEAATGLATDCAVILSSLGHLRTELGEEVWTNLLWKNHNLITLDGDISKIQALEKMMEAGLPLPDQGDGFFQFGKEIQ